MKPVVVLEPADIELVGAARFYEERSRGLGADFLAEVEHGMRRVGEYPRSGTSLPGGFRRRLLRRFPYAILYKEDESEIVIVAIVHLRRRPDYWRNR